MENLELLTPKEIVKYLDKYVIGQKEAKKAIAIALRNRYRRLKLTPELQKDILPKNILMIGSTGVGKTEIARRLAAMLRFPFIKVEASKYTEIGFVGRDVESMIRDLANIALQITREEESEKNQDKIDKYIEDKILEVLVPKIPTNANEQKQEEYRHTVEKMRQKLQNGELDESIIKIEIFTTNQNLGDDNLPPQMISIQESIVKVLGNSNKKGKLKELTIKDAKKILRSQASESIFEEDDLKEKALQKVEQGGIIFIDEIDKIAVGSGSNSRQDPSKEGVQRDLLPIVEGSSVTTKIGIVKTDHILFIAAGAFHISKPSDLLPELQGRFPLRVELSDLDEDTLYRILTEPKNSLIKQYQELLKTEDVTLIFDESSLREMAHFAFLVNEKSEDIGARRLHTIIEKVLEELSFEADSLQGQSITITKEYVKEKIEDIIKDEDATNYIL